MEDYFGNTQITVTIPNEPKAGKRLTRQPQAGMLPNKRWLLCRDSSAVVHRFARSRMSSTTCEPKVAEYGGPTLGNVAVHRFGSSGGVVAPQIRKASRERASAARTGLFVAYSGNAMAFYTVGLRRQSTQQTEEG